MSGFMNGSDNELGNVAVQYCSRQGSKREKKKNEGSQNYGVFYRFKPGAPEVGVLSAELDHCKPIEERQPL